RLEAAAHLAGGPVEQAALVVLVPKGRLLVEGARVRQAVEGARVAAALPLPPAGREEGVQLVAGDRVQPAAGASAAPVVLQAASGPGNGAQNLLGEVGRVGVLEAALPPQLVHQWRVDLHELIPGVLVARVADADQKAGPGNRRIAHAALATNRY